MKICRGQLHWQLPFWNVLTFSFDLQFVNFILLLFSDQVAIDYWNIFVKAQYNNVLMYYFILKPTYLYEQL